MRLPAVGAERRDGRACSPALIAWAKQEGYQWFNLGMAPLSGLEASPVAPLWAKVGRFVYGHGETFYNFQGLRAYKEKFDPGLGAPLPRLSRRPRAAARPRRRLGADRGRLSGGSS